MPPCNVLIWYWGRTGAGPLYALELMRAMRHRPDLRLSASIAAGNAMLAETRALGLPLDIVPTYSSAAGFAAATLRLPAMRRRFRRWLDENKFDIVLSTMSHLWTALFVDCVTASGAAYIPVLHDATPHPGEAQPLWRLRRQREIRHAAHLITLSESVTRGVAADTGFARDRISIIPYGVPAIPGLAAGPRSFPAHRPFRFMFFGRILDYKGLGNLIAAFRALQTHRPNTELHIVGAGDLSPYASALAGLPGVTIVNRWIEESEIPHILNQADAIVLPYNEASQSGVTSQAYAACLPVIVTPVGGLAEQVIPDATGLVAASTAPSDIAASMAQLLDHTLYDHLSRQLLDYRRRWSFGAQGATFAELFHTVRARKAA